MKNRFLMQALRSHIKNGLAAGLVVGAIAAAAPSLTAQNRDFNAERLIMDDAAGDGVYNTATLQVPPAGLSANRTIIFPDADGAIVTTSAPLAPDELLFGGPAGQLAQSANLIWNNGTGVFNIGAGNFTVDAATGNTVVGGTLDVGFTAGSVVFAGAGGVLSENNSAFYWDNAGERLGVGTSTPSASSKIHAYTTAVGMAALRADNISGDVNGQGIFSFADAGTGVLGMTNTGIGVWGYSAGAGTGLLASSENGQAGNFQITNLANASTVVGITNSGSGTSLMIDSGSSGVAIDVRGSIVNGLNNVVIDDNLFVTGFSDFQGPIGSTAGDLHIGDYAFINGDGSTNLTLRDGGLDRNSGATETLSLDNTGAGDINVLINGATSTTNSRLTVDDGHWTSQQTTAPVSAVAGANVTSAVLANETDVAGMIDITSSGTPAAGAQATVTFDAAYATAPIVTLTAANGAAAGIGAYVTRTTAGFTINFIGVPAASTSYQFSYQVIETQ